LAFDLGSTACFKNGLCQGTTLALARASIVSDGCEVVPSGLQTAQIGGKIFFSSLPKAGAQLLVLERSALKEK